MGSVIDYILPWANSENQSDDKASAQSAAISIAKGDKVVVASFPGVRGSRQGHIAIVRPDSTGTSVRIAQAGRVSSNNLALSDGFGSALSSTKFFTFKG